MISKPKTVPEYISTIPEPAKRRIQEMRAILKKAVPDAKEAMKWSMPSFVDKRILFIYGAFKNHIGFYPTPSPMKKFAREIAHYVHAKGSVQFPLYKPMPKDLITKMAKFRAAEAKTEDAQWKPK